jgi:hypothetical protein
MTYRAPPGASLARIEAFVEENVGYGFEKTPVDTHLLLALLRYAQAHGAVTVGDLEPPTAG